jgi:hypothetical protein
MKISSFLGAHFFCSVVVVTARLVGISSVVVGVDDCVPDSLFLGSAEIVVPVEIVLELVDGNLTVVCGDSASVVAVGAGGDCSCSSSDEHPAVGIGRSATS